ncbi:aryl-alcohol dehydrogenase-like predicted oxidoreductase [Nonomuraea thailandensis]|uniref:Aryl-alcohol dehydrogenase-like predicted oxidoreductase n=1 Tax=Nonomuraea thailandensis TaxID=1188745 RepID=A0A9X2K682_9ACTN|nr:aldo/keto reductase [Nonomuraea thailandensis]MCP2358436.1 aryl-alcohol dehydrogenase-like predicted oxidoreductase [Nonomuraea thailandensis]
MMTHTIEGAPAPHRTLGRGGPRVSPLGLGCMGMSQFYGPWDDGDSLRTIHHALDLGVNLLDTADMYGPYTNEELIGRAVRHRRDEVLIATKFGNVKGPDGRVVGVNGRPEYVRASCEGSLRRLGVDVIDVYCQHRVDPSVPVEETWGALAELVRAGKVRHLAISEASPGTVRRAHAVHPMAAVQTEYSLVSRDPEDGLLATLRALGIGFIAYAPLGRGLLTGRITVTDDLTDDDFRRTLPRFQPGNLARNARLVERIARLARERGVTPAQLALAWVLAQGDDVVPIPGAKNRARLAENVAATRLRLSAEDRALLDAAAPPGSAAGDRYPDMSGVGR